MISSTLRNLITTLNHLKPTTLTQITARFKYAVSEVAFIEQKLGLPVSPKRPIVPFFRYMMEIRKSVVAQNPTLNATEHVILISQMWKSLDDTKKEKYYRAHQNECITYSEKLAEYNQTVSTKDRQTVKEKRRDVKEEIEKRKYIRLQRKKKLELGKPKKPLSTFLKFVGAHADRQPNEKYPEYLRRKSFEWNSLSESQKEVFKSPAGDMQNYINDVLEWKGKMLKLGKYDAFRSDVSTYTNFDEVLKLKKTS